MEYQNGFGHVSGEYWLGLDRIHRLAKNPVTLRFDLGAPDGRIRFAVYQGFTVKAADQKYQMRSGKYTGKSLSMEQSLVFCVLYCAWQPLTPTVVNDPTKTIGLRRKIFVRDEIHGTCSLAF